jgi:hypothetical protein
MPKYKSTYLEINTIGTSQCLINSGNSLNKAELILH